jgi:predicted nucleic acid-binding protein
MSYQWNRNYGVRQSRHRSRYENWLSKNLLFAEIQPVSEITASHYAEIRIRIHTNGTLIPASDIWIAAIALELKLTLLINDHHFDLIPELARVAF